MQTLNLADALAISGRWAEFESALDARPELARAIVARLIAPGDPHCEAKLEALRRAAKRISGPGLHEERWWTVPHPALCGRAPQQVFGDNSQVRALLRSVWQP